ncbi:glycosyltransferase family 4 protein [Vibrio atypicus]|uniref:glycosyltransferase family 4 protein n=1 Tax=Vibrio atypicus TaxID=558271 RepID=UPI003735FA79
MKKVAFITSNPLSAKVFLSPHIEVLSTRYEVTLISNFSDTDILEYERLGVTHIKHIPLFRNISLAGDLKALILLVRHFSAHHYDSVHSITPKAGLIGMVAARITGISKRYHTFTGQVWVTKNGLFRALLKSLDSLIARCTTTTLADSLSQAQFLYEERVVSALPKVLGNGSICGVDITRFSFDLEARTEIRSELGIGESDLVYLFLGRLCGDKGINELVEAFKRLSENGTKAHLLLVGPNEEHYDEAYFLKLSNLHIHRVGFTNAPQNYYSAADIFVLPSYREGFGSSVLEAAAAGVPAIASNIYGLSDAVVDQVSGLLVPAKDVNALYEAMRCLDTNVALREKMGFDAYLRSCKDFSQAIVVKAMVDFYQEQQEVKND